MDRDRRECRRVDAARHQTKLRDHGAVGREHISGSPDVTVCGLIRRIRIELQRRRLARRESFGVVLGNHQYQFLLMILHGPAGGSIVVCHGLDGEAILDQVPDEIRRPLRVRDSQRHRLVVQRIVLPDRE